MGHGRLWKFLAALVSSKRVQLGAGICAVLMVTLLLLCRKGAELPAQQPELSEAPVAGVTYWKIELPGETASGGVQKFSGFYGGSKVFFVPAGAPFTLAANPPDSRGELRDALDANAGNWLGQGGKLSPANNTSGGMRQTARAPLQPGLYQLCWRALDDVPLIPASAPQPGSAGVPPALIAGGMPALRNIAGASAAGAASRLTVLVLAAAESEVRGDRTFLKINGKSIGGYHDPLKSPVKRVREHASDYQIPKFFAALNSDSARLRLGPGFELGDLIAFKDYMGAEGKKVFTTERHTDVLPLRPELIEKLVKLRQRLQQKGIAVTRFGITSGFRTPDYNRSIGGAMFSRHCYGDAIDLYIDEDHNHKMDDLNGDGKIDRKDGLVIANACRELELEGAVVPGGIGVYEWDGDESVRSHVHIDCRGYISRWGQIGSGKYKKTFKWWPPAEFQDEENGE